MKRLCLWSTVVLVVAIGWFVSLPAPLDGSLGLVQSATAALNQPMLAGTSANDAGATPVPLGDPDDPSITVTTTVGSACGILGLQFSLLVCNTGNTVLNDVVISNTLPIGMVYVAGSLSAVDSSNGAFAVALCSPPAGQLIEICLLDPLPAGECITITFDAAFSEALCNHVVVTAGGSAGQGGAEGCTPGFWKNHFSEWAATGYAPGDDFDTVFGVDGFDPDVTLEQAVNNGGGQISALGRHAVAALLSAAHPDVNYGLSVADVIAVVQQALSLGGDVEAGKDQLANLNEMGCPIGEEDTPNEPLATETICLDDLLGGLIACDCSTNGGGGTASCDLPGFCDLDPGECDKTVLETCVGDWQTGPGGAVDDFWDDKCAACCPPDDFFCDCLFPGGL